MPKVVLYNQKGSQVGELELSEHVFGVEDHQQAIFDTVIAEQAAKRQGTQKAKTRSEVRGGGVVFAPVPRSYDLKVNKKVARLAMRCALSSKVRENQIFVVDSLELADFKTKNLVEIIDNLQVKGRKVAIVLEDTNANVELAGRNVPYLLVQHYNHISVYEMMNVNSLIITKAAVEKFEEVLK